MRLGGITNLTTAEIIYNSSDTFGIPLQILTDSRKILFELKVVPIKLEISKTFFPPT